MKKLIIATLVALMLSTATSLAKPERLYPKAMLGADFIAVIPTPDFSNENYGGFLSYRHNFNFMPKNHYFSVNGGYVHYSEDSKVRNDVIASLGYAVMDKSSK